MINYHKLYVPKKNVQLIPSYLLWYKENAQSKKVRTPYNSYYKRSDLKRST